MVKHLTPINEITLHYKRPKFHQMPRINSSTDSLDYLYHIINKEQLDLKEKCWVVLMTLDHKLLGISEVFSGSVTSSQINVREILQLALLTNAIKIIVIHNHPSGNLRPSPRDLNSTRELIRIGKLMQVILLDHLIISSESVVSLKEIMKF
ncbi:JAB domain-containing protein [Zunongwangia profunda]|uniref:JAB domain-containing protein n=1 Tax=Zunongwangia profunda TaxID=398743 RepID=UPI0030DA6B0D